jgi:chromosome segregation ATPase
VLLATALKEANTPIPAQVQHIVAENSTPAPSSKGLKQAVDKMDKARKKFRDAQSARQNLHSNWRKYIADSLERWTQFAEKFGKDDQELAEKVKTAHEKLQQTKEAVETAKLALEELDTETAIEITDDEMNDKLDSSEVIQANISKMVENLASLQQKADAALLEAGETRPKRPRLEATEQQEGSKDGSDSRSLVPFAQPGK